MNRKKIWILTLALVICIGCAGTGCTPADRSGWVEQGTARSYRDASGNLLTLWQDIDGMRFYFGTDGVMVTGWQDIDGKRYFFGEDGCMVTSWQEIDGKRCYFGVNGVMATLWRDIGGKYYYFGDSGAMATLWQDIDGSRYYFGTDGIMVTGEQTLDGSTYTFHIDGSLITGWYNGRYHLPQGGIALGWQEIDGKHYFFGDDGTLLTGWLEDGEDRYYLLPDGSAAVGPVEIDGELWHFSPKGKQIYLVNNKNHISENYSVEIVQADRTWVAEVMAEPLERMLADCRAEGLYPAVVSGYRTYWDQRYMYNNLLRDRGSSAKLYCAEPNASEHQLGLAVDIVQDTYRTLNASQENTKTFKWFSEHCWEYGFIVRYPNGTTDITGVAYEPWHYRYVGVETAMELKELGITLEEYLGAA